ncbi:MAG TPA: recombinase family protein [Conexibacter sp.]|nr:recombinase family protein [Conexibacter sp.]
MTAPTTSPVALASPPEIHDRPKIAAIYARVSSTGQMGRDGDDDGDGYSLPAQIEAATQEAKRLGATVVKPYVERAESARSDNRPVLQEMLRELPSLGVTYLIVHKVDRLARNRRDDANLYEQLLGMGITLVSATENIDATPAGRLMHGMLATFAEYYSNNLATEIKKGLMQKHKTGGTPFKPPIGYRTKRYMVDGRSVATVKKDEERAPLVQLAFELYATGDFTLRELGALLEANGLRSVGTAKRPPAPLALSRIHRLLRNPYYVGIVEYCGKRVDGRHDRLVEPEMFEQVGKLLDAARIGGDRSQRHAHYLRGQVYCDLCDARLIYGRHRGKTGVYYEYFCCARRTARRSGGNCPSGHYSVPQVARGIEELYATIAVPRKVQTAIRADLDHDVFDRLEGVRKEADRHKRKLSELEANQTKLVQMAYRGLVSDSVLASEQERLTAEQQAVRRLLAEANLQRDVIEDTLEEALATIDNAQAHYLAAPDLERRLMNRAIFRRISIGPDGDVAAVELTPVYEAMTAWHPIGPVPANLAENSGQKRSKPAHLSDDRVSTFLQMVETPGIEPGSAVA